MPNLKRANQFFLLSKSLIPPPGQ
ncbi:hypothetical protein CEXT_717391, partial [Caerostris extrusa]